MKVPVIELMDYNVLSSVIDYFDSSMSTFTIHGKKIEVVPSFMDIKIPYKVPALAIDLLYRRNRSIGFGNFYGEEESPDSTNNIVEIEGTILEYRIQLNVYSNTRGENFKWSSILDEVLKNGEDGIALNTYLDNGSIKQENVGNISYDYSQDVRHNPMNPNIKTYDFHTIYEVKAQALQQYKITYDIMEIGDIIGKLKRGECINGRV